MRAAFKIHRAVWGTNQQQNTILSQQAKCRNINNVRKIKDYKYKQKISNKKNLKYSQIKLSGNKASSEVSIRLKISRILRQLRGMKQADTSKSTTPLDTYVQPIPIRKRHNQVKSTSPYSLNQATPEIKLTECVLARERKYKLQQPTTKSYRPKHKHKLQNP